MMPSDGVNDIYRSTIFTGYVIRCLNCIYAVQRCSVFNLGAMRKVCVVSIK